MFSRFASNTLRGTRTALPSFTRSYASSAAPSSSVSHLAPYILGAGLVGGGVYYYTQNPTLRADEQAKAGTARGGALGAGSGGAQIQGTEATKDGGVKVKGESALSPDEFRSFKIVEVIPYNHNTSRFVFALPQGTSSGLTVASALVCKAAKEGEGLNDKGKPVIRPYTPVTAPDVTDKLELLIKHYKGGAFTEYLWKLKPGDSISMKGPIPKHPWKPNQYESVAMIAGGSGITPMWQVLQAIDANPEDKTKATLIFSNVTEEDILLRKEFEDLAAKKPEQFKIVFTLDQPPKNWNGPTGYVSDKVITDALKDFGTTPDKGEKVKIFVCGPPGQVKAVSGPKKSMKEQGPLDENSVLKKLGYSAEQVFRF
ncbi:hypothetical protein JCM10296v2_006137 [Rhodotorula toruloides]